MLHVLFHLFCLVPAIVQVPQKASLQQLLGSDLLPNLYCDSYSHRHDTSNFQLFAKPGGDDENKKTNNSNDSGSPPAYDPLDKAVDVFDSIYFYGSQAALELFRQEREDTLQNMTVREVFLQYTAESGDVAQGLKDLVIALRGALPDPVLEYFAPAKLSVEDRLAALETIDLSAEKEVTLFKRRSPMDIPIADDIWTTTSDKRNNMNETERSLPLGFVLGPSGSGKTFFALQYLSRKLLVDSATQKSVTIYFHAKDAAVDFNEVTGTQAAADLVVWIKDRIRSVIRIDIPTNEPLEMRICLIVDEAGVADVKEWFENETMLRALCAEATKLATSVAVVLSGVGLSASAVSSSEDAYVFRMKQWKADDVAMILNKHVRSLKLVEQEETTHTVAEAIFAHPKLGALATNARSAYFLVKAVARHSQYYNRLSWNAQLDEWTKTLVMEVVHQYIASNGISRLSKERQRHVAASIFRALRELKKGKATPPTLLLSVVEAKEGEITVAESLLQYNCELVNGKLQLVDGERFAFTVTPAIAVVLFAMVGIPATLTPGWKAEEELAALYAVQQLCINCMEAYVYEGRYDYESMAKLDRSLEQVCLISLQKKVKSAKTKADKILIPMVGASAVLLNADKAPFADAIAPYMLIQAKQSSSSVGLVELHEEMEKCCLLKSSSRDTRVLRGLLELWRGRLEPKRYKLKNSGLLKGRRKRDPQDSDAFPANLLSLVPQFDPISYAVIEGNDIVVGKARRSLPPLDVGTTITFMMSTNVDKLKLKLSSTDATAITISERNLDPDLEIMVDTLSKSDQLAWARFLQNEVREGVVIKFLLTKSA